MTILVVGLNHRTAPNTVLELSAVASDDVAKVLHDLVAGAHVAEAVVLSTCNRTEVYAEVETFHGGVAELSDQLARICGLDLADLSPHLYVHHEARAVAHLFTVATGLDAMLVGETQVIGQVRAALRAADDADTVGRCLTELFSAALRVGKRAHSETGIDAAGASIVSVGVRLAAATLAGDPVTPAELARPVPPGLLAGRELLLIGAGTVGALAGAVARRAGAAGVVVANRDVERAERLAGTLSGRARGLGDLADELARVDVVISSTGAAGTVVTAEAVAAAAPGRAGRPLVLVDLALPRDVDPAVRDLPGVTVIDLETLRTALATHQVTRDVEAARALVADEVTSFSDRRRARRVAPTVVALRAQAAEVVREELDRLRTRVDIDPKSWTAVERALRRVADKLLHTPTVRVQALAAAPGGDAYAEALRELFDLPREAPATVATPDPLETL
jgi:glutamyl-tRNA reductase